jgi:glycerol-3-phosphate dehydrogenase
VSRKDLLVIGGGISGAAVALAAARRGLSVLLVERHDYAAGASSNSSKLVHGGLRYLKQGAWGLMRESLQAREQLLRDAPGLVRPMPFLMPHRPGGSPGRLAMRAGLFVYDQLAGRRTRRFLSAAQLQAEVPGLAAEWGASGYEDASTDDARLTLRLLQEAREAGAELCNHSSLLGLERAEDGEGGEGGGRVRAARVRGPDGFERRVETGCVIVSAGAQLGSLAAELGLPLPRLRPLRGSHLLLPLARLPLPCAVAWSHAQDGRPVFAYPWWGALLVGTTDVDQMDALARPRISREEQDYLIAALNQAFPLAAIGPADVQCSWSGLRPVIASADGRRPSEESREHLVLAAQGVVGLSGGKLTTFAAMAEAALRAAAPWLPPSTPIQGPLLPPAADGVWGDRLGPALRAGEQIGGTPLAAIRHSLRHEQVRHLDDLLLRRTRLGLLQPGFAAAQLPALKPHCQELLGWDTARFAQEAERYLALMRDEHGVHA